MFKRVFGLGCAGLTALLVVAAVAFTVVREDLGRAIERLFGEAIEETVERQVARFDPDLEVEDVDLEGRRLLLRRRSTGERVEAVLESSEGERLVVREGDRRWVVQVGGADFEIPADPGVGVEVPPWLRLPEAFELVPLDRVLMADGSQRLIFSMVCRQDFERSLLGLRSALSAAGFYVAVEVDRQTADERRQAVVVGRAGDGRLVRAMLDRFIDAEGQPGQRSILTVDLPGPD